MSDLVQDPLPGESMEIEEIRTLVAAAQDRLLQSEEETRTAIRDLQSTLAVALHRCTGGMAAAPPVPEADDAGAREVEYGELVGEIRDLVSGLLPPGATVLVATKGDDELLRLDPARGWHFPQDENGEYPWFYPADDGAAIEHLEALRGRGADYLLFPSTAFWWLEHYARLRDHLRARYRCVHSDERCVVYDVAAVAGRSPHTEALVAEIAVMAKRESELHVLLGAAEGEVRARDREIRDALRELQGAGTGPVALGGDGADPKARYRQLVGEIHEVVRATIPAGATVLLVSKGDDDLVRLSGRRGWHFPQAPNGSYAGHHPADGGAAIEHLEALRGRGADYLLFPSTAFWWLEHYARLRDHLRARYRCVHSDERCIVYRLAAAEPAAVRLPWSRRAWLRVFRVFAPRDGATAHANGPDR